MTAAEAFVAALLEDADGSTLERLAERLAPYLDARSQENGEDRWLDVKGAAAYLSCPASRIYELKARNEIPFEQDGRRLIFKRSELDSWVRNGGGRRAGK